MTTMDLNDSIRQFVPWMVNSYSVSEESRTQSKKVLNELITQMEVKEYATQRLYLMYYLVDNLSKLTEDEAVKLLSTLLPIPLKKNISTFLAQLVSLAISVSNTQVLTATAQYIEKEQVSLPQDIERLPLNLAEVSPRFAAALIDKGYFNTLKEKEVFTPQLLTSWLNTLNSLPVGKKPKIAFNAQSVIRYSLLGTGQGHTELHLAILKAIEHGRVGQLSNQFIIDLASQLSNRESSTETTVLIERLAHILVVALQFGACNKFSNQVRNTLTGHFPDSILIKTLGSPVKHR